MTGMTVCGLQPRGSVVEGEVLFNDVNLIDLKPRSLNQIRGAEIAMIFQDPTTSLHPMLNIGTQLTDHLRTHRSISKPAALAQAAELLDSLKVPEPLAALRKYPHQFSGGQLQRIAIGGAIICEPKVVIADEPTTALDVIVQAEILRLLRQLCDDMGLAILLISHDLGVLSAVADKIVVMRDGEVVEDGARFDVITNPTAEYTRTLIDSLPGRFGQTNASKGSQ
jgi:ABC-type dipeptide/oligopeptide/nickel transport system ATPase component